MRENSKSASCSSTLEQRIPQNLFHLLDGDGASWSTVVGIKRLRGDLEVTAAKMIDYSLWEVIENGNAPLITKVVEGVETTIAPTTAEEKAQRRFWRNAATKKTKRNLLKQQYENFTTSSSEVLDQTFDRLQKLISQLEIHGPEIDTLSLDDLYNNLKIYEPPSSKGINDQAEEGPTNFSLITYSFYSLTLSKTGLESVEARLLVYKKNEYVYKEDIKVLKCEIHLREVAITDLRRKLELAQKQKDEIQLTVENFENSSKNLSKLIDYQIVDKCKTGLGYNAVPPPYTRNFMPPKPNLSFSGLEDFISEPIVIKPVAENSEANASEAKPKAVRKNNSALIIED
ncbi:hypothetical protein Tco_0446547 [Tanacetum coccineum]